MSFGIDDIDNHWMRDLRFNDTMQPAPTVGLDLAASYQVTQMASLYLAGSFEKVFHSRGDVKIENTVTGDKTYVSDGAGASFQAMSISFGLKGRF